MGLKIGRGVERASGRIETVYAAARTGRNACATIGNSHGSQGHGTRSSHLLVPPSPRLPVSPSRPRRGLTLYEVFLALIILLGAMTVLSQHIAVGTRAGVRGRLETQAALLCEAKLAEVLGGVEPMSPVSNMALETPMGTGWSWTLEVAQGPSLELLDLAVTVTHVNSRGDQDASFTLRRFVRDPQVFIDAANAEASAAAGESAGSGGVQ